MKIDNDPVFYCNSCLSLHIVINNGDDVCGNCGAVNFVSQLPFDKYQEMINETSSEIKP